MQNTSHAVMAQRIEPADTYVALASSTRAIIGYLTGKRDGATTDQFIQDLCWTRRLLLSLPSLLRPRLIDGGSFG